MYAFSIYIVDSSIDMKICKTQDLTNTSGGEAGKCTKASEGGSGKKLSAVFAGIPAKSEGAFYA